MKVVMANEVDMPSAYIVNIQANYKYRGILQSHGNHDEECNI